MGGNSGRGNGSEDRTHLGPHTQVGNVVKGRDEVPSPGDCGEWLKEPSSEVLLVLRSHTGLESSNQLVVGKAGNMT